MLKKRIAVIVSLALIMSTAVFEPAFARTSNSSKKTVYAVSSWTVIREKVGKTNRIEKTAKVSLVYTKNGLLKTIKTKDKNNYYPHLKGEPKYSYEGKRLTKVTRKGDNGSYATKFKYKKGKLKSATFTWKSKNPVATFHYVKNGKQAEKDIYDTHSRNHKLKLNSRGRVLCNDEIRYNKKGYPTHTAYVWVPYTLDEHGFPDKSELVLTEADLKALGKAGLDVSSAKAGTKLERYADYTFDKNGRLKKAVVTYLKDGKTYKRETFRFKYRKIDIPASYNRVFNTQQYDIVFFFADPMGLGSYAPESTAIGFGKVG